MEQQQVYRGKFSSGQPTAQQLELLKKLGVRKEIIESLNRQEAFELIRKYIVQYYDTKAEQYLHRKGALKW